MKLRSITSMESLTTEQLDHVAAWLEAGASYPEVSKRIQSEFDQFVSPTSLHRFYHRHAQKVTHESRLDLAEDAKSWLNYAAKGEVDFSDAALEAIKQETFELAVARRDFDKLKGLFSILCRTRNTSVRERSITLQERKFDATQDPDDRPLTTEEQQERLWKILGYDEEQKAERRRELAEELAAQNALELENSSSSPDSPSEEIPCPAPDSSNTTVACSSSEFSSENDPRYAHMPLMARQIGEMLDSLLQAEGRPPEHLERLSEYWRKKLQEDPDSFPKFFTRSAESLFPEDAPAHPAPTAPAQPCPEPALATTTPAMPETAGETPQIKAARAYHQRRSDEYLQLEKEKFPNGTQMLLRYKTKCTDTCPCGQPAPCEEHRFLAWYFFQVPPWADTYKEALDRFRIPYDPAWLVRPQPAIPDPNKSLPSGAS